MKYEFHIAVNARFLLKDKLEGIGRFSHEVLKLMVQQHPEVKFSFFFDRAFDPQFIYGPNVQPYVLFPQARHVYLWKMFFEWSLPRKLRKLKPDVFFSPDGYLSLRARCPQVPVIHDLAFEHYPDDIDAFSLKYYRSHFPEFARKAAHVMTVSEFTKQDIVNQYGIAYDKITVTCNGVSRHFQDVTDAACRSIREKFTDGKPFFHFVGAIQPRKNLDNLIKAFDLFREKTGSSTKLLIVGRKAWNFEKIFEAYTKSPNRNDIILTGYVSDEDLNRISHASRALCYVPYFEGFGIPVVESMACGTPVICSNVSSLPEVAGDAALLADPFDPASIAAAMEKLDGDAALRKQLAEAGRLQQQKFTWQRAKDIVWDVLKNYKPK